MRQWTKCSNKLVAENNSGLQRRVTLARHVVLNVALAELGLSPEPVLLMLGIKHRRVNWQLNHLVCVGLLDERRGGAAERCAAAPEHWFPQITHFTAHKAFNLHTEQIHSWRLEGHPRTRECGPTCVCVSEVLKPWTSLY